MRFGLNNADGRELASLAVNIPPPQVTVTTSMGTFVVQLDPDKAPKTVNNFLTYVNAGFYTNVIFHRVIPTRVIQAGGYTAGPTPKATSLTAIPLESNNGLLNLRGTIAMARLTAPNTATSQFYINVADNTSLNYVDDTNPGYAVFGTVVSGMDVIDAINVVPTQVLEAKGLSDVPVADVTITQAFQNQ
ncbi:MAG: peptidylprolyl isomerase [Burkholderiales bacterium]|nr:peptidylprolyl isomerase [Burkholderiales bacterium]